MSTILGDKFTVETLTELLSEYEIDPSHLDPPFVRFLIDNIDAVESAIANFDDSDQFAEYDAAIEIIAENDDATGVAQIPPDFREWAGASVVREYAKHKAEEIVVDLDCITLDGVDYYCVTPFV